VPERKLWYCFDGSRWVPDLQDLKVAELAKKLSDELICYVTRIEDERRREVYLGYCKKWMRRAFRDTIVKEAQSVYPISMDDFDADIYAFNCKNGTLHLDTMEFRPHNSADMITKLSPVNTTHPCAVSVGRSSSLKSCWKTKKPPLLCRPLSATL
jgi:putative DNA primase/helicase